MKKILTPIDGSLASEFALVESIRIAKENGGSIKLLTVVDNSIIAETDGHYYPFFKEAEENSKKMLDRIADKMDFAGVPVEKEVVLGLTYATIVNIAESEKFDLIVMGRRGFSKAHRFFVGSVTQRVLEEAKTNVLIINSDEKE